MIKLKRPAGPRQLREPAAEDVDRERREALKFYTAAVKARKEFPFKIYRQPYVKETIEKIFHKKCAYCESLYIVTQPVDIEHFRPKGAVVVNNQKKPGYYWLASDWTNLLPSCIRCNRSNSYLMPNNKKETMGKKNFFPLEDEGQRATKPGDERNEKPLLLNPFNDNPAKHLEFTAQGVVRAALNKGEPSSKGLASITICALSRPDLVERRAEYARKILAQIERVKRATLNMQRYPNDSNFKDDLRKELRELKDYLEPNKEYAAMARQLAKDFLRSVKNVTSP
jgi:uncharacterized protein (TIGR02646 family)